MRNKEVQEYLEHYDYIDADEIVERLIKGGFIEEDKLSTAEEYAEIAKRWLGGRGGSGRQSAYDYASGWGSVNWEFVLKTELGENFSLENNIQGNRDVFAATVILAKEAGIEI